MSDSPTSTPPKPKPGSLRDRIAAFENKAQASTGPDRGPPPPRPKPAGFAAWKPKQPSPPSSPNPKSTNDNGGGGGVAGGMNAADAKESITRAGGSLKERMAALQGKGAFGAPAPPPTAPKPAVERPKWKPPPLVVQQPAVGEEADEEGERKSNPPSIKSPPPIIRSPISDEAEEPKEAGTEAEEGADAEPAQVDEEEEERQRRAAIAARMAKLGGARIGMGPPIFGRPAVPPPSKKPSLPPAAEPPNAEEEPAEAAPDTSPRPPTSMPMASIPKRTAPPRRKPVKQTSSGAVTSPEESPAPPAVEESVAPSVAPDDIIAEAEEKKVVEEPESVEPEAEEKPDEVVEATVEEEEDEETRKKRVAERLAKMGGVNPFALPPMPLRKGSVGSTASAEGSLASPPPPTSPPIPTRKPTLGSPKPVPVDKPASLRRGSGSSLESPGPVRRASVGSVASVGSTSEVPSVNVGRRASVGSVRSVKKEERVEEVQEIVEEPESAIVEEEHETHGSKASVEKEESSSQQLSRGRVASVIPPPPPRSPPTASTSTAPGVETRGVPLPPRIVPSSSRDHSVDNHRLLSGPSPPRRIVPQTPEVIARDVDDVDMDDVEEGEEEGRTYERGGRDVKVGEYVDVEEEDVGEEDLARSTLFVPPPLPVSTSRTRGNEVEIDDGEESDLPLRVPPPPPPLPGGSGGGKVRGRGGAGVYEDTTDTESNASGVAVPVPVRVDVRHGGVPMRSVPPPPPPPPPRQVLEEGEKGGDSRSDYAENIPLIVPPRLSEGAVPAPGRSIPPPPPGMLSPPLPPPPPPKGIVEDTEEEKEKEVLDEDEGDPIDPSFHSPSRRGSYVPGGGELEPYAQQRQGDSGTSLLPSSAAVRSPVAAAASTGFIKKDEAVEKEVEKGEEDEEKVRRRTIAERMARLGGIKFGAGGIGIPGRPPIPVPPKFSPDERAMVEDEGSGASESGTSEDGVKVEAEESEMEEVGYEEVRGEEEEEGSGEEVPPPPPPPPPRRGTGGSGSSVMSPTSPHMVTVGLQRPPVPVPGPFRRGSGQSTVSTSTTTSATKRSQVLTQQSEYVIVDEPRSIDEEAPPPPPARPVHRAPPPSRTAPPPPPPPRSVTSMGDSISSQWELPAIPTSSLGPDLSASWSEALVDDPHQTAPVPVPPPISTSSTVTPAAAAAAAAPQAPPTPLPVEALHLTADDLMAIWGRVGVQICEIATTMYDQSKKSLIGDGTYRGFIDAVLNEVPNAAKPQHKQIPYGYLVYLQSGGQVQKRASEIMPGDVVEIVDARFKGHKGLGGYQQMVGGEGAGGALWGIVCESEVKKSKIRVFQANQHVGQQTVESASYRLDDLKSGLVKVYRVLEA
ncbi:SH3 domain-containing protein C23A1.17 [Leucoagaricus sp. SymC.cos]|nr:SH3 domain-containing protein C23A1.17 [Leucoagaricus sp. SymC.cos]